MLAPRTLYCFEKQCMKLATASPGLCARMPAVVLNTKILTVASKATTIPHQTAGAGKWFISSLAYLLEGTVSGYTRQKVPFF